MRIHKLVNAGMGRYLWAFNPYARMLRGAEPVTPETTRLSALILQGDDETARENRRQVQEFIDRENQ